MLTLFRMHMQQRLSSRVVSNTSMPNASWALAVILKIRNESLTYSDDVSPQSGDPSLACVNAIPAEPTHCVECGRMHSQTWRDFKYLKSRWVQCTYTRWYTMNDGQYVDHIWAARRISTRQRTRLLELSCERVLEHDNLALSTIGRLNYRGLSKDNVGWLLNSFASQPQATSGEHTW
jgi:hypothetical protein